MRIVFDRYTSRRPIKSVYAKGFTYKIYCGNKENRRTAYIEGYLSKELREMVKRKPYNQFVEDGTPARTWHCDCCGKQTVEQVCMDKTYSSNGTPGSSILYILCPSHLLL